MFLKAKECVDLKAVIDQKETAIQKHNNELESLETEHHNKQTELDQYLENIINKVAILSYL